MITQSEAKVLSDDLASETRAAGSDAEARVQVRCRDVLESAGFNVCKEPFEFKTFSYKGICNNKSANLVATRGIPNLWLVAHSDTKSQLMPPAMRVIGTGLLLACLALAAVLLLVCLYTTVTTKIWIALFIVLAVSTIPVFFNPIGNRSKGAIDNASGMAAVLLAVQSLSRDIPLGVLITSGEERFMAGARNFVRNHKRSVAINCDGLDDVGKLRCWYNRGQKDFASQIAPSHASKIPPGILLDATVLAKNGWRVVTISKGTLRTLWRIHTRHDTPDHLSGQGIVEGATLMREIVLQLFRGQQV